MSTIKVASASGFAYSHQLLHSSTYNVRQYAAVSLLRHHIALYGSNGILTVSTIALTKLERYLGTD